MRGSANDTLPRSTGHPLDMSKSSSYKGNLAVILASLTVTVFFWRISGIMLADDLRLLQQTPNPLYEDLYSQQRDKRQVETVLTEAKLRPRQLRYDTQKNTVHALSVLPDVLEAPETKVNAGINNNDNDKATDDNDDGYDDDCHVVNRQHQRVFPTCNRAHEVDGTQLSLINCGGSRCAFHFGDFDDRQVVLKLPK